MYSVFSFQTLKHNPAYNPLNHVQYFLKMTAPWSTYVMMKYSSLLEGRVDFLERPLLSIIFYASCPCVPLRAHYSYPNSLSVEVIPSTAILGSLTALSWTGRPLGAPCDALGARRIWITRGDLGDVSSGVPTERPFSDKFTQASLDLDIRWSADVNGIGD